MLIYLENNIIVIFQVQKNTESNTPNIARKKTEEQYFCQNDQCVTLKNRNLSKSKRLADY